MISAVLNNANYHTTKSLNLFVSGRQRVYLVFGTVTSKMISRYQMAKKLISIPIPLQYTGHLDKNVSVEVRI